MLLSFCTY